MSLSLTIDTSRVTAFADAMERVPQALDREMRRAGAAVLATGVGLAQEFAPVDEGTLRASIGVISRDGWGGSYGSSLVYAWMRERGGTIHGNPWLVFRGRGGNWVKVRSVTQTGSHYMERSLKTLRPHARAAYAAAAERALASAGVA